MNPFAGTSALIVSFVCTVVAVTLSLWHILQHLRNYTEPTYQRYMIRIIFMVPVYATMSFLALAFTGFAMYFNTIRDVYEAWVIYNFLSLCLSWVGGPGAVVTLLAGRILKPSWLLVTCCLPPLPLDGRFIRHCKQGCLQFVYLKPLLAVLSLLLYYYGLYEDGNFALDDGYAYITAVYMLSYSVAIYALILFYVAAKDLLKSFNPIPKFLMIKAVVFLTYWQGVIVFLIAQLGLIASAEEAADLQNVLICFEMALGAMGFMVAFPFKPFKLANVGEQAPLLASVKHALTLSDVVNDTVHQFAPTYHDYVLYSDGSETHHFRTRTFVPAGKEMESVRRNISLVSASGSNATLGVGLSARSTVSVSAAASAANDRAEGDGDLEGGASPTSPQDSSEAPTTGMLKESLKRMARAYDFTPVVGVKAPSDSRLEPTSSGDGSIRRDHNQQRDSDNETLQLRRKESGGDELHDDHQFSSSFGLVVDESELDSEKQEGLEGFVQR